MARIDTHVHVWDRSQFPYSWTAGVPLLNRSFLLAEYLESTRDLGHQRIVLVEADVDEAHILNETRYLLALADQHDCVAGVVAGCRPETDDFKNYLRQIAGHARLKGLRRVLHSEPDHAAESKVFIDNISLLGQYGLTFDLCVLERQLPSVVPLVKECAQTSFVLDHCGGPAVKAAHGESWTEMIQRISDFPNVVCKVSGLVGYAGPDTWEVEDVRHRVECVIRSFGWERIMFGSDWPVCTISTSPRQWTQVLCAITKTATEAQRRKLFVENAERTYRL